MLTYRCRLSHSKVMIRVIISNSPVVYERDFILWGGDDFVRKGAFAVDFISSLYEMSEAERAYCLDLFSRLGSFLPGGFSSEN